MSDIGAAKIDRARKIISSAQQALHRRLSDGERRDLLKDNTRWTNTLVAELVDYLRDYL